METKINIEIIIRDFPLGSYVVPSSGKEYAVRVIAEESLKRLFNFFENGYYPYQIRSEADNSAKQILEENAPSSLQLATLLYAVVLKEFKGRSVGYSYASSVAEEGATRILNTVGLKGADYARILYELNDNLNGFLELVKKY